MIGTLLGGQNRPTWSPKAPQMGPKWPPNRRKIDPQIDVNFFIDFSLIFHWFFTPKLIENSMIFHWNLQPEQHVEFMKNLLLAYTRSKFSRFAITQGNQKSMKKSIKNHCWKLMQFWRPFWIDFGRQNHSKIDKKSIKIRCKNRWEFRRGHGRHLGALLRVPRGHSTHWSETKSSVPGPKSPWWGGRGGRLIY